MWFRFYLIFLLKKVFPQSFPRLLGTFNLSRLTDSYNGVFASVWTKEINLNTQYLFVDTYDIENATHKNLKLIKFFLRMNWSKRLRL